MKTMPLKKMGRKKPNEVSDKLSENIGIKIPERVYNNLKKKLRY